MSRTSRARVGNFVGIWILLAVGYEFIEGLPRSICFDNKRLGLELDPTDMVHSIIIKIGIAEVGRRQHRC